MAADRLLLCFMHLTAGTHRSKSLRQIAAALNARGIATARGVGGKPRRWRTYSNGSRPMGFSSF